ncbi:MAG TPA: hypothetical protein VD902_09865 [Symbiobacteriaceae bacterium]|nr:hypothetical protein [Symbiobacteriaceae bacterium]
MTLRLIARGLLTGAALTAALAAGDWVSGRGYMFGLLTGLFGIAAGGIMLLAAFAMAVAGYLLARQNKAPALTRQLVAGAIFTGAAGMTFGFSSAAVWMAVGLPWFP